LPAQSLYVPVMTRSDTSLKRYPPKQALILGVVDKVPSNYVRCHIRHFISIDAGNKQSAVLQMLELARLQSPTLPNAIEYRICIPCTNPRAPRATPRQAEARFIRFV